MEEKFRSLDTTKKPMQEKILKFDNLVSYLNLCGFKESGTTFALVGYPGEKLKEGLETIYTELKDNSEKFGVKVKSNFNPYQESISSTTGNSISSGSTETSQYNPNYIDKMMEEERKVKRQMMERKIEDREIKVFNTKTGTSNFKKLMQEYEEENRKEEEEFEEELRKKSALKMLGSFIISYFRRKQQTPEVWQ